MRWFLLILVLITVSSAHAADVFVRFRVVTPASGDFRVELSGHRHADPWRMPVIKTDANAGAWSDWIDLSKWPWHERFDRAGGIAEWPSMSIALDHVRGRDPIKGCAIDVQLADKPDASAVVHSFQETSESDKIAFLVPTPLRAHASEFETGSQMTARHLAWAMEASAGAPAKLKDFTFITALWGHYDPGLARSEVEALKLLGFNMIGNCDPMLLKHEGIRTYNATWMYHADPAESDAAWAKHQDALKRSQETEGGRWSTSEAAHYVVCDEIQTLNFTGTKTAGLNAWFRDYLRSRGVTDADLPKPLDQVEYPAKAMYEKSLPRDADLPTRKLMYHAAKFGHLWSAKQLRHSSDLIRSTLPGVKTEALPSDHGFFNAWGPPHIGMSYRMLDLFELCKQRSVDQLSAEDWLGLNHMYGPAYTWTGAQSFEYWTAICRSAMNDGPTSEPMMLRGLLTVSDDAYLRLKAYSAIGQGATSFFFWTFGPTYIGTENYWSDLRSEYDGIAKLGRAMEKAEPVLMPAKPVRDPVAILYSVSHDIWHTDDPAAFVEKRLTWHALRHLHVQPDFLREEDVDGGKLDGYKVLYVNDWCVSRAASEKIDAWVKAGGVLYLSAGAATRDEFYEPYIPPYAAAVWPADTARTMKKESHTYNERTDLPTIAPITTATVQLAGAKFDLPVLGCQLRLQDNSGEALAHFADGAPAAVVVRQGRGKVYATGFLPMLAYAQGAHFAPATLSEKWPEGPRRIIQAPLNAAGVVLAARCDVPVVETSLLDGERGAAVVLANYTYQPIAELTVDVKLSRDVKRARSAEGVNVRMEKTSDGLRLRLPLKWTDIVTLE